LTKKGANKSKKGFFGENNIQNKSPYLEGEKG
jgi:hypothetical protein